jgi:Rrf2 family protein
VRLSISRRTDLGLKALRILAAEPGVWTASALAEAVSTTPGFISQAMAAFVHAGWVYSGSGPSGGYLYARPARPPSLLEVIEAIEGPTAPDACVLHEGKRCGLISGEPLCELHEGWLRAREVLVEVLGATPAIDTGNSPEQPRTIGSEASMAAAHLPGAGAAAEARG